MKQVKPDIESFARIRVIGTGGSGCNAVNHMIESKVRGVDFVVVNTDAQDLHHSPAKHKVHIGKELTRGLGSGMNADIGRQAAEENLEEIQDAVQNADMVFITCGLGGGTGTGSAPVVARASREAGALTVAVVTLPFTFEGQQRKRIADEGLAELRQVVDAIIVIHNDRILDTVPKGTGLKDAFATCDDVLKNAVEGISDLITKKGLINVDFNDIRAVMDSAGSALMGIGEAGGDARAADAAKNAISSPLLDVSISGATGILVVISGKDDLSLHEAQEAVAVVTKEADSDAKIIFGTIHDDSVKKGSVKVTVIATGFNSDGTPAPSAQQQQEKSESFGIHNILHKSEKKPQDEDTKNTAENKPTETTTPKQIHNTVTEPARPRTSRTVQASEPAPRRKKVEVKQNDADEDDNFSMIPGFLKRSRLR